jgi:hypothetical protein
MKTFHPAAGFWLRIAAVGLLAAALLLGGAGLAQAHAVFLRSDPAAFYQKAAQLHPGRPGGGLRFCGGAGLPGVADRQPGRR